MPNSEVTNSIETTQMGIEGEVWGDVNIRSLTQ